MSAALSLAVSMFLCATLDRRVLAQALTRLKHILPRRASLPALDCVLVEGAGDALYLTATDARTVVRVVVPATVTTAGTLLVPHRRLAEVARGPGAAKLHLAGDQIAVGAANHRVVTQDPANFPATAAPQGELVGWFDRTVLARMLAQTSYAMSIDDTRPHLAALLIERRVGELAFVATDGHRLALARRVDEGPDAKVLVDRRSVEELVRLVALPGGPVSMRVGDGRVWFASAGEWVSGPVVDATFPAYTQVIPQGATGRVTFVTTELREAVRALAPKGGAGVTILLARDAAEVVLRVDDGAGNHTEARVLAAVVGDVPAAIGVNAQYLREVLDALGDEDRTVSIAITGELDPFRVDGAGGMTAVVMPMRV